MITFQPDCNSTCFCSSVGVPACDFDCDYDSDYAHTRGGVCYWVPTFAGMSRCKIFMLLIAFIGLSFTADAYSAGKNSGLDSYLYAQRLFDEGYYDLAAEQLERLLQNLPEFPNADEAQYLLAESYFNNEQYKKARAAYLRLAIVFPESPLAAEGMYKVASVLESMKNHAQAAHAFQRVHGFYPKSNYALPGLANAIRLYDTIGDTVKLESAADIVLSKFPLSAAADQVRLRKAAWLTARHDHEKAKSLLKRLAVQTTVDSLAAEALLELGRIYRAELHWEKAHTIWKHAAEIDHRCQASYQARLEIADLLIYQGLTVQAIDLLTQAGDSAIVDVNSRSIIKLGDAHYRQGNYDQAHAFYRQAASDNSEARLKSGWAAEMAGNIEIALEEYLEIASDSSTRTPEVKIRIAMIAQQTGRKSLAKRYWLEAIADTAYADSLGNAYWELSTLTSLEKPMDVMLLDSLASQLKLNHPRSPFTDDTAYQTALGYDSDGQYQTAMDRYNLLIEYYPASPFRDAARYAAAFIERVKIRSPQLVERMAELSSAPQGSVNPVKWAADWGDFYLDDFKDAVRAIDHYDQVIQDVLGSTDMRTYCLFRSGEAYLNLCQTAQREYDAVAVEMYCDSAHFRLNSLEALAPGSDEAISLRNRIAYNNFILAEANYSTLKAAIDSASKAIAVMGIENIQPMLFVNYFQAAHLLETIDSSNYAAWLDNAQIMETAARHKSEQAEIRYLQLITLSEFHDSQAAIDSAKLLIEQCHNTPAAGRTMEWLIQNPHVSSEQKLEHLHAYRLNYYYRLDPELHAWQVASAYDSLGLHFESLVWRDIQNDISQWGSLQLDILNLPDADVHYLRGAAHFLTEDYERSAYEFRSYLNLKPVGDHAAEVIFSFIKISMFAEDYITTTAYLDTLDETFPFSDQAVIGDLLRPRVEMALGNYAHAFDLLQNLSSHHSDPDSSFEYDRLAIVCQYRLNKLDSARQMAKAFYKKFNYRDDFESIKALFYLEKGRALQKSGNFKDARKNFQIAVDRYSLSEWTDDAEFELAMSFLKERKWAEGTAQLTRFLENYPEAEAVPEAILTLGMTHLQEKNYSEALKYLKSAWLDSRSEQTRLSAFTHLMTAYRDLRFWDAAIHLSREYLEKYPSAADAFNRKMDIGQFYIQIGEYAEAVRHYRPMLDYSGAESEAEIQFYIGESYQKDGDYQTAILEYMKVRILGRKTKLDWGITALYQSGICYELLNDVEGTVRIYQRIIKDTGATSNYGRTAQKRLDGLQHRQ